MCGTMNRLVVLSILFSLTGCSKPIAVVVRDGPHLPCEAAIPDGPNLPDMAALQTTLASAGNPNVVVHANRGITVRCISAAKDAVLRAGKQVQVERDMD